MINKKVDEAVFELLLTHAFRAAYAQETEQMEAEDAPQAEPSAAHRKQEKRYYRRKQRKPASVYTVLRQTAACIFVCMGIGFCAMLFSPPVRAAVWDTMITVFEKYVVFDAPKEENALVIDGHTFGYIPDDFAFVDSRVLKDISRYRFSNGSEEFTVGFSTSNVSELKWDNENSVLTRMDINGVEAYFMTFENGCNVLFWAKDGQTVFVQGNIDKYQIKNIAENLS